MSASWALPSSCATADAIPAERRSGVVDAKVDRTRLLLDTLDAAANGAGGGHEARFPSLYP
jgi:hypothetical protein